MRTGLYLTLLLTLLLSACSRETPEVEQTLTASSDGRAYVEAGDLVVANLTVTPARAWRVAFTLGVDQSREVLVGKAAEPSVDDLDGIRERGVLRVITRNNSATYTLREQQGIDVTLVPVPTDMETEEILYQESRFDPEAVSWVGARGLMRIMPHTAEELRLSPLDDPEVSVLARFGYVRGQEPVNYVRHIRDRYRAYARLAPE